MNSSKIRFIDKSTIIKSHCLTFKKNATQRTTMKSGRDSAGISPQMTDSLVILKFLSSWDSLKPTAITVISGIC